MEAQEKIKRLYSKFSGQQVEHIQQLAASGSNRIYYRIRAGEHSFLGAYNPDPAENRAFISFSEHFLKAGLNVPEIYAQDLRKHIYLLEDLGDVTLYKRLCDIKKEGGGHEQILSLYLPVIPLLIRFQTIGHKDLNYRKAYPRARFDRQSIMWDLNYFKYYFLKLAGIRFNEQALERDFIKFSRYLSDVDSDFFMVRDFQSRNLMLHQDKVYLIDYQGGRRGPLQYDLASLLYDAKAELSQSLRQELLEEYCQQLNTATGIDPLNFKTHFYSFVYIRLMQAMGAYGYRGFYERKEHFLLSIPLAVNNLRWLLKQQPLPLRLPELNKCLHRLCETDMFPAHAETGEKLHVNIMSFSYKKGLPRDFSGHGGGFVFDCRALPNPGRYPEYQQSTGRDINVARFLEQKAEVRDFYHNTEQLVLQSVENYLKRGFGNLMVCYGCTGGQHRSVWCAEELAKELTKNDKLHVTIQHREQDG